MHLLLVSSNDITRQNLNVVVDKNLEAAMA